MNKIVRLILLIRLQGILWSPTFLRSLNGLQGDVVGIRGTESLEERPSEGLICQRPKRGTHGTTRMRPKSLLTSKWPHAPWDNILSHSGFPSERRKIEAHPTRPASKTTMGPTRGRLSYKRHHYREARRSVIWHEQVHPVAAMKDSHITWMDAIQHITSSPPDRRPTTD